VGELDQQESLTAGATTQASFDFDSAVATCREIGCAVKLAQCGPDGTCGACASHAECGAGAVCFDGECIGNGHFKTCRPCTTNAECLSGGICVGAAPASFCEYPCDGAGGCPPDSACSGTVCIPDPSRFEGCGGYDNFDKRCRDGQVDCEGIGVLGAVCGAEGRCTLHCSSDADCPVETGSTCNLSVMECRRPTAP
jgi:hypothetical protein